MGSAARRPLPGAIIRLFGGRFSSLRMTLVAPERIGDNTTPSPVLARNRSQGGAEVMELISERFNIDDYEEAVELLCS